MGIIKKLSFNVSVQYSINEDAVFCENSARENLFNAIESERKNSALTPFDISADWITVNNLSSESILQLDLANIPIVKNAIVRAINAVEDAAKEAHVSPVGFNIDNSFCDCGEIETSGVVDVIDETGSFFGEVLSEPYNKVVDYICTQVTSHFKG